MPRNAKSFADEIDRIWNAADAEGRDLTPAERIHMSELVVQAKGQHDIEKSIPNLDTDIVLYCRDGFRSLLAADNLQRMGYTNVRSMAGGFREWKAKGLPVD